MVLKVPSEVYLSWWQIWFRENADLLGNQENKINYFWLLMPSFHELKHLGVV